MHISPRCRRAAAAAFVVSALGCRQVSHPVNAGGGGSVADHPAGFAFVAVEAIEDDGSGEHEPIQPRHVETLEDLVDALPVLAAHGLSVGLAIQGHKLSNPAAMDAVFSAIERARESQVEVHPWLLLSFADGYFPSALNADKFAELARDLLKQWEERGLPPSTLLIDMEPSRELQEALSSVDLAEALPREQVDDESFVHGQEVYAALVDELHGRGWKAQLSTLATLLADYRDEDDDLRRYFNVVIDGVAWDQLDFQLYRSAFGQKAPGLGPHFVYTYVQEALARFPEKKLGFTLGLIHPGPIFQDGATLENGDELRKDVEAALAAGAERSTLSVFNLKGILDGPPRCDKLLGCSADEYAYAENDPQSWLERPAERTSIPEMSAATGILSAMFDAMDAALDVAPATDAPLNGD